MKRQVILLLGLFAVTMLVLGCKSRVPYGYSFDRHEFLSTPDRPMTIVVERRLTGEQLWRKDVPVGQRLIVEFGRESDDTREGVTMGLESHMPADWMTWQLIDDPNSWVDNSLDNRVELPGQPIRMRMVIRTIGAVTEQPTGPAVVEVEEEAIDDDAVEEADDVEPTPVEDDAMDEDDMLEELDDAVDEME